MTKNSGKKNSFISICINGCVQDEPRNSSVLEYGLESVGHCRLISVGSCHFLRYFDEGVSCYFFSCTGFCNGEALAAHAFQ